jgi:hypothetical protein
VQFLIQSKNENENPPPLQIGKKPSPKQASGKSKEPIVVNVDAL